MSGAQRILEQLYDHVHLGLWSLLITGLIFLGLFAIPNLPAARAKYEATRALAITAEHDLYCRKLGFGPNSGNYPACILVLQDFRRKVERRLANESLF